jgi:hypothetical protein
MVNWSWLTARRLQTQLLLWTALILIVSVVGTQEARIRSNLRLLEDNLRTRSETMIRAVDEAVGLRFAAQVGTLPLPPDVISDKLDEFVEADSTLVRLDVVQRQDAGMTVVASSRRTPDLLVSQIGPEPHTEIRRIGQDRVMVTSRAVEGTNYGVVAVASMENIDRFLVFNRGQVPAFAAGLLLVVIVLMHVMFKRTVSRRFDELLDGIRRAKRGEAARIPDTQQDEIGVIAKTLNGRWNTTEPLPGQHRQRLRQRKGSSRLRETAP